MKDQLPMNGNADIDNQDWIVFARVEGELRRFTVSALSEQSACIEVEDKYGVEAISARLKASRPWSCTPYVEDCNRVNRITKALG
jgi:hypothetical protein